MLMAAQFEGIPDEIRLFFWYARHCASRAPPAQPSTADLNPIGAVSKVDLRKFIIHARDQFDLPILERSVRLRYR